MKKRIIPSILLKGGSSNVCLSQAFSPWRTVGTLPQQLKLHISRNCDELLILNLNQSIESSSPVSKRISKLVTSNCDVPVGYAGGVFNEVIASQCINQCFDKIFLTSAFLNDFSVLSRVVSVIGSQSVGICLPYKYNEFTGKRWVWDFMHKKCLTDNSIEYYIERVVDGGAGEIFLYSVDRDGQLSGLDVNVLPLLDSLKLSLPVLLGGGAGKPEHFSTVLETDLVQGVVASSIFALTKETPSTVRKFCLDCGISMRII